MSERPDSYIPPYDYYLLAGRRRFEPGESIWRKRGTHDWLMLATFEGRGRIGYNGEHIDVGPGEWILLRPGTPHDYGTAQASLMWDIRWVHFIPRPYWLEWMAWPEISPGVMRMQLDGEINGPLNDLFDRMNSYWSSGLPNGEMYAMALLEEIFLECAWACQTLAPATDQEIQSILDYIEANLRSQLKVDDLCQMAGISKNKIAALFREHVGEAPRKYLEGRRVAAAKHQLDHTIFSIQQISENVGYSTPYHFSRRFREIVGQSPLQYRNRNTSR